MPKPEKVEKVKELTNRFNSADGAIFADYRGLTVKDITELRRILGDSGTSLAVVKKTLTRLAVKGALIDGHVLGAEDARSLATVERREVSMAKVAGLLQAPVARLIYLLQAPLKRIAYALSVKGGMMGPEPEGQDQE